MHRYPLLIVAVAVVLFGGCESRSVSNTKSESDLSRQTSNSMACDVTVEKPDTDCGVDASSQSPAKVEMEPQKVTVSAPVGSRVKVRTGHQEDLDESSRTASILQKAASMPWYVYGIGAGLIALSCVAAWLLKSPGIAILGAVGGLVWVAVFVLIEFYTWVFLLVALLLLALLAYAGHVVWKQKQAEGENVDLSATIKAIVSAVEQLPSDIKSVVTEKVQSVSSAQGTTDTVKDQVTAVKRDTGG